MYIIYIINEKLNMYVNYPHTDTASFMYDLNILTGTEVNPMENN